MRQLFKNGRSQAVRLPRELRFEGDRVRVRRAGHGGLVEPISAGISEWFAELDRLGADPFTPAGREQPPSPPRHVSMTTYLLDTNACIALINGAEASRDRHRASGPRWRRIWPAPARASAKR